ncbi:hypothetical protein FRB96_007394 [Tulasnella sp. 330]|nr:hypothetical protein FRB96_007394 [Tulasnella sp. 330]
MPPKKGGKGKGRKHDDDDEIWEKAEASTKPVALAVEPEEEDRPAAKSSKRGFASGFAGLSLMEGPSGGGGEEDEDFGGLMSAIKSNAAKPKKEKKKKDKKRWDDDDEMMGETIPPAIGFADGPGPGEGSDGEAAATSGDITAASHGQEMTAEELADLEFGPAKGKKSKGKKGGKKGKAAADDEDPEVEPIAAPAADAPANEPEEDDVEGGGKVLSKKEKEKLKKEKEKERKKEEAAKKKKELDEIAALVTSPTPTISTPAPAPEKDAEAADGAALKTGKKKKKKGAADEVAAEEHKPEPKAAAPPAAGPPKKVSAKVAALRAAMEAQRVAQEEAARKAEEEKRRIEEEERRAAEEEKRKEEEKLRRKEREKAKKEQARKEGKLLTDKQKRDRAAAEVRRQAILASGVKIAALEDKEDAPTAPKKFSYAKKGGKKPVAGTSATERQASAPQSPAPTESTLAAAPPSEATAKEDWEDGEDEKEAEKPATVTKDVKSDWDASSDEAEEPVLPTKVAPPPASAPKSAAGATKPSNGAAKGASAAKAAPTPTKTVAANGKATLASSKSTPAPVVKGKPPPPTKPSTSKKEDSEPEDDEDEEEDSEESDSDSDEDSDEESSEEEERMTGAKREAEKRKEEAAARRAKRMEEAMASRSKDDLRSPICCILGHVDTGKTKLLDKIRQTNVQEGEAGGITQQIGATYFPVDAIREKTKVLPSSAQVEYNIPGLLIIDTPGHESFTNLRTRGSSLCNIAVLVHGLEPQTLESLRLLRDKKTPFIVALNKIDRMYGWEKIPDNGFQDSLAKQKASVRKEFETRCSETILAFAEQGLNAKLYYENDNPGRIVSLVPTSAVTGEGVPDMIMLLVKLTQERMSDKLMYISELECTVLEVKVIEGLGTTIDVVLSNGWLHEGDRIVVCGLNGPIVTNIRALLTPQPLREMRIKGAYVHLKEVKAALGVKITAPDLEKAIAGSRLLVVGPDDDEDELREEVMSDLTNLLNYIDKSGRGVCVQASTLGSLEALLEFLKVSKIPVSGINIGPVHKKDVMRSATMLEKAKELACILCFDVPVDKDAERMAEEMGIRLFKADIIYHLFDAFTAYNNEIIEAKRRDAAPQAVWPCRLRIIACFAKRDPIILGVDIVEGTLRIGTPLCVVKTDPATGKKEIIHLGKITSLEINHKAQELIKKSQAGAGVAVKIEHAIYEPARMYSRHFDDKDEVISQITRQSIDVLKDSFRADVAMEEWALIKQLKVVRF